jgi:hypothetical protein
LQFDVAFLQLDVAGVDGGVEFVGWGVGDMQIFSVRGIVTSFFLVYIAKYIIKREVRL